MANTIEMIGPMGRIMVPESEKARRLAEGYRLPSSLTPKGSKSSGTAKSKGSKSSGTAKSKGSKSSGTNAT